MKINGKISHPNLRQSFRHYFSLVSGRTFSQAQDIDFKGSASLVRRSELILRRKSGRTDATKSGPFVAEVNAALVPQILGAAKGKGKRKRMNIITARRMISGLALKYRKGERFIVRQG